MNTLIKKYWNEKPLALILFIAIILRLLAAFFSKGFGMHDDHFLVIEASQSWVDGTDYNRWLPSNASTPSGHSWFYVGLHYLLFSILKIIHITEPQTKMLIVRILHAFYSLSIVYFGYRIAEKLSNKDTAKKTALLLATFWFMSFLSVRNLSEFVCVPPLFAGLWMIIRETKNKNKFIYYILAGLIIGISFSMRYQTLIFISGIGLALLMMRKWNEFAGITFGVLLSIFIIQGITDTIIWGYPFAELKEYIQYNIDNAYNYETNKWYSYSLLIAGILIPPISFFMIFGFFKSWKKHLILFLPTILFIIFHSYFPNKQERFILPAIPFVITLGLIGWYDFKEKSNFWNKNNKLYKSFWIFFWIINLSLLPIISTMYSKKARVESMVYLSQYPNIGSILLEDSNRGSAKMPPQFYLKQWIRVYDITQENPAHNFKAFMQSSKKEDHPKFVLFFNDKNIKSRLDSIVAIFPKLQYETTIYPGFVDVVLYKLNPKNANEIIYIYKTNE